jgi:hypothetical protein
MMIKEKINSSHISEFEKGLNPLHPDKSMIPAKIIGYGEMSTIFVIDEPGQEELAYKRMPIFFNREEMRDYEVLFNEYNELLSRIGLDIPAFASVMVIPDKGNLVIYNAQKRLPSGSVCNALIHTIDAASVNTLILVVLREMKKIFDYNASNPGNEVGIDGQISNWAVAGWVEGTEITEKTGLFYLDTSTPLMKKAGREMLNPELFLRSTPSFLRWFIRLVFLDDVMNRYYDFRKVAIDLIGNFHKEQRSELIPGLVETANTFFSCECSALNIAPLTIKEVDDYYKEDALIWRVYLAFRKLDRFLHLKILNKPYPYILPGNIKR